MFFYKRGLFSACFLLQLSLNFWNSVFSKLQGPVILKKIHVFENETSHWVLFHVFGHFFPNKEIAETWIHRNRSEEVINRSPMRSNIIPVAHNVGAQANCTTMSCPAAGLRAGHGHAWIETLAIWKSKSKISRSIYQPRGSRYLGCCFRSSFVLPTNPKKILVSECVLITSMRDLITPFEPFKQTHKSIIANKKEFLRLLLWFLHWEKKSSNEARYDFFRRCGKELKGDKHGLRGHFLGGYVDRKGMKNGNFEKD